MRLATLLIAIPAALVPVPTSGCGQCAAVCVPNLVASGEVALPDANDRTLALTACRDADCHALDVTLQGGSASCHEAAPTSWLGCTARFVDPTHVALDVAWIGDAPTVAETVTYVVADTTTSTVLLDASGAVTTVAQHETCGAPCGSATVLLSALP